MLAFFISRSLGAITQNVEALSGLNHSPYEIESYEQSEIDQALQDRHLTPDMALQLHQQGTNWEINTDQN